MVLLVWQPLPQRCAFRTWNLRASPALPSSLLMWASWVGLLQARGVSSSSDILMRPSLCFVVSLMTSVLFWKGKRNKGIIIKCQSWICFFSFVFCFPLWNFVNFFLGSPWDITLHVNLDFVPAFPGPLVCIHTYTHTPQEQKHFT